MRNTLSSKHQTRDVVESRISNLETDRENDSHWTVWHKRPKIDFLFYLRHVCIGLYYEELETRFKVELYDWP